MAADIPPSYPSAECVVMESARQSLPPRLVLSVMLAEGGLPGQRKTNTNGSIDHGPMQVNSVWLPVLARHYQVPEHRVAERIANDGCANVAIGAWILRQSIDRAGSLEKGIMHYHSRTEHLGRRYLGRVMDKLMEINLRAAMGGHK